jgi:uncharacterized alpha-E superfamily protein
MLSRVADSLYWMSRYLERAEHTARVVTVNLNLSLDRVAPDGQSHRGRLSRSLPAPPIEGLTHSFTDDLSPGLAHRAAIAACLTAARENARQVREQVTSEMWEQLNGLYLEVRDAPADDWTTQTHEALTSIIEGAHLFQGVTDATMAHGEGWHYIRAGRFLERAGNTASMLTAHFEAFLGRSDQPIALDEFVEWVGILKAACAFESYCRYYTADLRATRVAEFLILNADFPRSIRFAASQVEGALKAIAHHTGRPGGRAERLAGRFRASLDFAQVDELMSGGLRDRLRDIGRQCADVHTAMYETYITYPIAASLAY